MNASRTVLAGIATALLVLGLLEPTPAFRRAVVESADGWTYLHIDVPRCAAVYVDGELWPHVSPMPIRAGTRRISCGLDDPDPVSIVIAEGTTYHFDYR